MITRTYRLNLVGEPEHTTRALHALDALFEGDALDLLSSRLAAEGLAVQRLVADATEVVLYITAETDPIDAPVAPPAEAAAAPADALPDGSETEAVQPGSAASGGGTGSERPPA